jgi:hypothetical protein
MSTGTLYMEKIILKEFIDDPLAQNYCVLAPVRTTPHITETLQNN